MYFCLFCEVPSGDGACVSIHCCYENLSSEAWNPAALESKAAVGHGESIFNWHCNGPSVENEEVDGYLSFNSDMLIAVSK